MTRPDVFYFDDEQRLLDLFREMFEDDFDVRTASTLAEARRLLAERPAEIVISDQQMPEITGTEFLAEVARLYPASYRVVLTGSVMVGQVLPELTSGVVQHFLHKPWSREDLERLVERAALRARPGRDEGR